MYLDIFDSTYIYLQRCKVKCTGAGDNTWPLRSTSAGGVTAGGEEADNKVRVMLGINHVGMLPC